LKISKQRPEIKGLIEGGETIEYSAHVIPEAGMEGNSETLTVTVFCWPVTQPVSHSIPDHGQGHGVRHCLRRAGSAGNF